MAHTGGSCLFALLCCRLFSHLTRILASEVKKIEENRKKCSYCTLKSFVVVVIVVVFKFHSSYHSENHLLLLLLLLLVPRNNTLTSSTTSIFNLLTRTTNKMASTMTSTASTFLRRTAARILEEGVANATFASSDDEEGTIMTNNTTTTMIRTTDDLIVEDLLDGEHLLQEEGGEFDPVLFWCINSFLLVLLISVCILCYCGDKDWFLNPDRRRQESDIIYHQQLRARLEQQQALKVETPAKRKQKLLQSFKRHKVQMTVKEEDLLESTAFHMNGTTSPPTTTSDVEAPAAATTVADLEMSFSSNLDENKGTLRLPVTSQRPPVPNCCAVCLGSYDVGDEVIWSSNPQCSHAFHSECIIEWLIKMQPATPCPCCRQEFTDLESVRKEAKIIWTGDAFNPAALRL